VHLEVENFCDIDLMMCFRWRSFYDVISDFLDVLPCQQTTNWLNHATSDHWDGKNPKVSDIFVIIVPTWTYTWQN